MYHSANVTEKYTISLKMEMKETTKMHSSFGTAFSENIFTVDPSRFYFLNIEN